MHDDVGCHCDIESGTPITISAPRERVPSGRTRDGPAPAETAPAEAAGATAEAPAFAEGLDDPAIPLDDLRLRLRLVPLTVDELTALAEAWRANARDATLAVVEQSLAVRAADGAASEADVERRTALMEARGAIFER